MINWIDRSDELNDFNNSIRKVIQEAYVPKVREVPVVENEYLKIFESVEKDILDEAVKDSIKGTIKNTFSKSARSKNAINKKTLVQFGIPEQNISENIFGKEKVFTVTGDWDISGRDELDISSLSGVKITVKGKFDCSNTSISTFRNFPIITCADFVFKNGKAKLEDLIGCPVARRNVELDGTKLGSIVGLQLTNTTSPEKLSGNLILANTGINNISIKRNENYNTSPAWSLKVAGILDLTNCFPIENINWFIDVIGKGIVANQIRYNVDEIIYNKLSTENKARFDKAVPTKVDEPISMVDFGAHLKIIRPYYKLAVQEPVVKAKKTKGSVKPSKAPSSPAPEQVNTSPANTTEAPVEAPKPVPEEIIKPNESLTFDINKLPPLSRNVFYSVVNGLVKLYDPESDKNYFRSLNALIRYANVIGDKDLIDEVAKISKVLGQSHVQPAIDIIKNIASKLPVKEEKIKEEKVKKPTDNKKDSKNKPTETPAPKGTDDETQGMIKTMGVA